MSTQKDLKTLNWSVQLFKDLSEQINSCPLPPGFTPNLFYMDFILASKKTTLRYVSGFCYHQMSTEKAQEILRISYLLFCLPYSRKF